MIQPEQINPALSAFSDTPLQRWDRSQRGRRWAKLDVKQQRAALTPIERETYRTLRAERRAIARDQLAAEEREAGANVVRFPGGAA